MPRGPVLTVVITSVNEGLDKGLKEAENKIGAFGASAAGKLAKVAKVAAPIAGVAAAAAKLGSMADKAATDTASFAAAMGAAGASAEDLAGPLAAAQSEAKNMAFSGAQAKDALVSLQTATGDAAKSAELLAVAQDVARLSGADLTVAADAVAKAYSGTDRQLRALLPGLPATSDGFATIAAAEELAAGQAEIFADSAEGMGIKTKAALKGLAITIGKAVQPAFRALLDALLPLVVALAELVEAVLPALIPLINAVARAFEIAAKAITKVVELVTRLISKIRELLGPLREAVNKLQELNPFKGKGIGEIIGGQTFVATAAGVGARSTGQQGFTGSGGVTINIYGDPSVIEARVTKALRDYARRNGAGAIFTPERA